MSLQQKKKVEQLAMTLDIPKGNELLLYNILSKSQWNVENAVDYYFAND
jgi:hypothetical protein